MNSQNSFIQQWLQEKKDDKDKNPAIIKSIESCMVGINHEELDESSLIKFLEHNEYGEDNG